MKDYARVAELVRTPRPREILRLLDEATGKYFAMEPEKRRLVDQLVKEQLKAGRDKVERQSGMQ